MSRPLWNGNRRGATVGVAELLVRAALADFLEAERTEQPDHLLWRGDWNVPRSYAATETSCVPTWKAI